MVIFIKIKDVKILKTRIYGPKSLDIFLELQSWTPSPIFSGIENVYKKLVTVLIFFFWKLKKNKCEEK